ncbi:MAG: hypothetical protein WCF90_02250 [Methanomicrobiales archaeon]
MPTPEKDRDNFQFCQVAAIKNMDDKSHHTLFIGYQDLATSQGMKIGDTGQRSLAR